MDTSKLEDENFDYKEKIDQSFGKIVCAYANTNGGKIIVGISKSDKIVGTTQKEEEKATNILENCKPPVKFRMKWEQRDGKNILIIDISGSDRIHTWKGVAYKRSGSSSMPMDVNEIVELSRKRGDIRFDNEICRKADLEDINWRFVEEIFIPLYEKVTGKKIAGKPVDVLRALEAIKNDKPTNAGVLLFSKDPSRFLPNSHIALGRYKGKAVGGEKLDYKEFTGNLFEQIDNCARYIVEHTALMSRLTPGEIRRTDIPEYGLFSIRELVTNAVCHRDYEDQGGKIIIKMFDDKIEFYNIGGLPAGITPDNITTEQYSRNPIIASVLAKVKYIEEMGEGWDKIIEEHRKHPLHPEMPRIISSENSTFVTLFSTKEKFEEEKYDLTKRQREIITYIKKNGRITTSECANLLKVSNDTSLRELNKLRSLNLIDKKGVGRGTYYIVK